MSTGPRRLQLYYRHGCHLCEDMLGQLLGLGADLRFSVDLIDVDGDSGLQARYQVLVPVLTDGDTEICRYFLDEVALRRWAATAPSG